MTGQPGWHPDPLGRHDYRWFNGSQWTSDVADDGQRRVDPYGINTLGPEPRRKRRRRTMIGIAIAVLIAVAVPVVALWGAVNEFAQPAQHEVEVTECSVADGTVRVTVEVTNLSTEQHSFTVFAETTGPVLNRTLRSLTIPVDRVPSDETRSASVDFPSTADSVTCTIVTVAGPLPFGIDIGPVGVQN